MPRILLKRERRASLPLESFGEGGSYEICWFRRRDVCVKARLEMMADRGARDARRYARALGVRMIEGGGGCVVAVTLHVMI
jgi:hypothetical protein